MLGLLLLAVLTGCALRMPTVPNWTPTPPAPSSTSSAPVDSPPAGASPSSSGSSTEGRPVLPIPSVVPNGYQDPPSGSGLERYRGQPLRWQPCGNGLTCTAVLAPLDYAKPDGTAITLTMARRKAPGEPRLGTLFINPSGPGGSGTSYVGYFNRTGLEGYDIVGWDPRGVGYSTPVTCMGEAELDRFYAMD